MEELTAALATSFRVTQELNTTAAEHPRFSQYKLKLSPSQQQEARRKKILEIQKKRRFDFTNHARCLTEGVWDAKDEGHGEEEEEEQEGGAEEEEMMEVQSSMRKPGRNYRDQLMYSEWLVEVPDNLETEWLLVVCPMGKRRLVVASGGKTKAYSKGGFNCMTFPSFLPGGNRGQGPKATYGESTILDCIYNEKEGAYYVLDMMYWKNMPIYDSETEFRFYWMHEKLQEVPLCSTKRNTNPYRFLPLPSFPCNTVTMSNAISCANFDIDGLLFYHKRTHYTFGSTPLVVWLKTYMVPDVLNIAVPYKEVAQAPPSYTNYAKHLEDVKNETYGARENDRPQTRSQTHRRRGRGKEGWEGHQGRGRWDGGQGHGGQGHGGWNGGHGGWDGNKGWGGGQGLGESRGWGGHGWDGGQGWGWQGGWDRGRGRGGRGRGGGGGKGKGGRGGGGGGGGGRGRREKKMDANESVEDTSAGRDTSLNFSGLSGVSDTTPQKQAGILQMPKTFSFSPSGETSPFTVTRPENSMSSSGDQAHELNGAAGKLTTDGETPSPMAVSLSVLNNATGCKEEVESAEAEEMADDLVDSEPQTQAGAEGSGKKSQNKKGKNRGRKGKGTKMDLGD